MRHPAKLKVQLKLYDRITKQERKRLITGYKKYGDSYKTENLITECIEEILDAFGYLILLKMGRRNDNVKKRRS